MIIQKTFSKKKWIFSILVTQQKINTHEYKNEFSLESLTCRKTDKKIHSFFYKWIWQEWKEFREGEKKVLVLGYWDSWWHLLENVFLIKKTNAAPSAVSAQVKQELKNDNRMGCRSSIICNEKKKTLLKPNANFKVPSLWKNNTLFNTQQRETKKSSITNKNKIMRIYTRNSLLYFLEWIQEYTKKTQ